jgi:hypothetical protein
MHVSKPSEQETVTLTVQEAWALYYADGAIIENWTADERVALQTALARLQPIAQRYVDPAF